MSLATSPASGIGISLGYRTASTGAFTGLVQLKDDCEFGGFDTTVIPVPTLATTTLTKVPGRTDNGDFTGSMYLIPGDAGVAEMLTLFQARTTVYWQLQLADGASLSTGSTYVFQGFISNLKPGNFTGEDSPTQDFTIAISGAVTFAAGS
jgi:hypothetical protein